MHALELGQKPLVLNGLADIPWIRHGFTHKAMGDLGISPEQFRIRGPNKVIEAILAQLGMDSAKAAFAHQVHSDRVGVVRAGDSAPRFFDQTDALICQTTGIPLVTFGADCPNVFLVDKAQWAIGLVHSGRLGTLAQIVPKTIAAMAKEFGSRSADIFAVISPSIGPCCYPTDLWGMLHAQLSQCGVKEIFNEKICTACHSDQFYSYRKSKDSCGRMLAVLMRES